MSLNGTPDSRSPLGKKSHYSSSLIFPDVDAQLFVCYKFEPLKFVCIGHSDKKETILYA